MPFIAETDSHFIIGASHKVCEDYTLHGRIGNVVWYVVCDGCSSSVHTDIGARVLAHTVGQNIERIYYATHKEPVIIDCARIAHRTLIDMGLDRWSLMTTLHIGIADPDTMNILSMGDGFDWYYGVDGLTIVNRDYENLPYYVGYFLNDRDHAYYRDKNGGHCKQYTTNNSIMGSPTIFEEPTFLIEHILPIRDIIKFGSSSDGAASFYATNADAKTISGQEVVEHLTRIASPTKGFMTRRLLRVVDDLNKKGLKPNDDIGAAAICVVKYEIPNSESGNS